MGGAVCCLLLLACANVAGLLMSRSVTRRHEMAVRAALGAGRWQITRQLLTESIVMASAGAVLGLGIAAWSMQPLLALTSLPRSAEVSLDLNVVAFTILAGITTGILFGLAPALEAARDSQDELRLRSGHTGRLRPLLVAFQIALAVVLLSGAGLLMRSFHRLQQVDTGLDAERVLTVRFFLPRASYVAERGVQLYERMIERMRALPGVETAAAVSSFPFSGVSANVVFEIPGRPVREGEPLTAEFRAATPGYFRTIGIAIINGRDFDSDSARSPFTAVVNRAFAERFFAGRNPIGESIRILGPKPRMIVGIIPDIRHRGLDAPTEPEIYVPHTQFPTGGMFLAVRTRLDHPLQLAAAVRREVRSIDPDLPIARFQSWTQMLDQTLGARRFSLILLAIFAALALTLSVIGIYGMLSFHVSQRTKEIGIRMAMGESARAVVRGAVGKGMLPVVMGLAGGVAGAFASTRFLKGLLFEIEPTDPLTLVSVVCLLLGAGFAASLLPARRAASIDPMVALRHDA
jgi:putative ABC transport system permease protein